MKNSIYLIIIYVWKALFSKISINKITFFPYNIFYVKVKLVRWDIDLVSKWFIPHVRYEYAFIFIRNIKNQFVIMEHAQGWPIDSIVNAR